MLRWFVGLGAVVPLFFAALLAGTLFLGFRLDDKEAGLSISEEKPLNLELESASSMLFDEQA